MMLAEKASIITCCLWWKTLFALPKNKKKVRKFWEKNNKQNSFYEKIVTLELIFDEINFKIIILRKNKIWPSLCYLGFETFVNQQNTITHIHTHTIAEPFTNNSCP